jgi:hypothetical protein
MPLHQVEVVAERIAHRHTRVPVSRAISGSFMSCVVRLLDQLLQSFDQQTRMSLSRWPKFRLRAKRSLDPITFGPRTASSGERERL